MPKLTTVYRIFKAHGHIRGLAICVRIICRKFSFNGPFGQINQWLLRSALIDGVNALNSLSLQYTLAYGTALGLRREGNLITYDGDVDVMVFQESLLDLSGDPDERDHRINSAMREHSFELMSERSAPHYHAPEHWNRKDHVPIIYQYMHTLTSVTLDVYVFARHDGYYWSYNAAGRRFPIIKMNMVEFANREYMIFPDLWLELVYGDWKTPKRPGEYPPGPNWGITPPQGIPPMASNLRHEE